MSYFHIVGYRGQMVTNITKLNPCQGASGLLGGFNPFIATAMESRVFYFYLGPCLSDF